MKAGLLLLAAALVAVVIVNATASGSSPATPPRPAGSTQASPAHSTSRLDQASTTARRSPPQRTIAPARQIPSPGSLPQTHVFPSGSSTQFRELMAGLWSGIASGRVGPALPAFFPRGAYVQLKAIESAGSDWSNRLVHDYALDIAAAHALLGRDAATARLLAVAVPSSYGHWVPPGVCYNSIGYYEAPNARIVYREHGQIHSFGIASLISWRGVWYVVHLGAILRSSDTGTVDEPASGRGSSTYSGTC